MKTGYNLVKDAYEGEAVIPLNKRGTKSPEKLSVGNPICEAGLAILPGNMPRRTVNTRKSSLPMAPNGTSSMLLIP